MPGPDIRLVSKEKKAESQAYFGLKNDATGHPYTLEEISAITGSPISTIGKWRQAWDEKQRQKAETESSSIRSTPESTLAVALRDIAGVSDERTDRIVGAVRAIPGMASDPNALFQYLTAAAGIKDYVANLIVRAVISSNAPPPNSGANFYPPQNPYGQSAYYPMPQQQGMMPQYQPQWGHQPYAPPYPPWAQPPTQSLSASDIAKAVTDALAPALAAMAKAAQGPSTEKAGEYEESEEPLLGPDGSIITDPATGKPLTRYTRRPIHAPQPERVDQIKQFREMAAALRELTPPTPPPPTPMIPPEMTANINAIQAELAAERVRREESDKYATKLDIVEEGRRSAEIRAATASAGMPPDAVVLNKALDKMDNVAANMDRRMQSLEKLALTYMQPAPPGQPIPPSDHELAEIERRLTPPAEATPPRKHIYVTENLATTPEPTITITAKESA